MRWQERLLTFSDTLKKSTTQKADEVARTATPREVGWRAAQWMVPGMAARRSLRVLSGSAGSSTTCE